MSDLDIATFVSYAIGSFGLGFGIGLLTVALKKAIDSIL